MDDCVGARAFAKGYADFLKKHPHFDADEPLEAPRLPVPLVSTDRVPSETIVKKLLNGTGDLMPPVVRIENDQGSCTGTFVAKNWIASAAHCLRTSPGWTVDAGESAARVHKWYSYTISSAGPTGEVATIRRIKYALQYFDRRYVGFRVGFDFPFDFALLYLLDVQDGNLPNNPPGVAAGQGPFMRVSLRSTITDSAALWGWGLPGVEVGE